MTLSKTLMARQGIYNAKTEVFAYELLYRSTEEISGVDNSDELNDKASSSVITNLFSELNIDQLLSGKRAFINFTQNHLLENIAELLPKDKVVIELLEY